MEEREWKIGDLVWTRVQGYPWWPGQVMDPEQARVEVRRKQREGSILVCFFGDNEYGWYRADSLVHFQEHYEEKASQKSAKGHKKFTKAVEEAKEIQDRRSGLQPLTDHDPIDFLDPTTFPSSDSDDADNDGPSARKVDLRPAPLEKEDAAGLQPHDALTFLQAAARVDTSALCAVSRQSADLCRQLLFSLMMNRLVVEHGDGSRMLKQLKRSKQMGLKQRTMKRRKAGSPESAAEVGTSVKKPAASKQGPEDNGDDSNAEDDRNAEEEDEEPERPSMQELQSRVLRTSPAKLAEFLRDTAPAFVPGARSLRWVNAHATEVAAALRHREKVFERSEHNQPKDKSRSEQGIIVGDALLEALAAPGLRMARGWATAPKRQQEPASGEDTRENARGRGGKRKQGLLVEVPDVSKEGRHRDFMDRVPDDREAFMQALQAFYAEHETELPKPVVDKMALDLYAIFKAVSQRGGYQAVSVQRQWLAATVEWRPELKEKPSTSNAVRKNYERVLLAFEEHLSKGAPEHMIRNTWGLKAAGKREAKTNQQASPSSLDELLQHMQDNAADDEARAVSKVAKVAAREAAGAEKASSMQQATKEVANATQKHQTVLHEESSSSESQEASSSESDLPDAEEEAQPKDNGASSTSQKRLLDKDRRQRTLSSGQSSALLQLKRQRFEKQQAAFSRLDDDDPAPSRAARPTAAGARPAAAGAVRAPSKGVSKLLPPKALPAGKAKQPGRTMLMINFPEGHMLPTKTQVWSRMRKFQKNGALNMESVLRNEKTKLISIKYRTPEEAAKAKKSLESVSMIFHAKREAVTLRVETPRTKPPQPPDGTGSRPNSAAAEQAAASQPAAAAGAAPNVAPPTDPRRAPSAVAQPPPDPRRPPTVVNQPRPQQPPAQPIIPSDPRRAPKTTVIGDPRQFQSRILSGPGQAAATTSYSAPSYPSQQPQSYAPSYPVPHQSAYAAPSVFPSDPRGAARSYAPAAQLPPPPQQPQIDAAAKIQAIRAAIAAQTVAVPALQPQPGPMAQARAAPAAPSGSQQPQQLGLSAAAAAAASRVAAGTSHQPQASASPGASAASPATLPLPVGAFDLVSILQNAGVKPAVLGAPPSSSAGPNTEEKPRPAFPVKAESSAQVEAGSASAGPGKDEGAVGPATAVQTDAQHSSRVEQTNETPSSRPNIQPEMMQLLGIVKAAAVREGALEAALEQECPNAQTEVTELQGNIGSM